MQPSGPSSAGHGLCCAQKPLAAVDTEGDAEFALATLGEDEAEDSRLAVMEEGAALPSADALELAESVLQRLKPLDRHEMGRMVYRNAVSSGGLLMAVVLFWWLSVSMFGEQLGGTDVPASLVFSWNFLTVSAVVPILVFVGSVLMMLSRAKGEALAGILAGAMIALAGFLALEPIGHLALAGGEARMLLHSARLIALGAMVHYCAMMFLDALLLSWVRNLLLTFPLDISPIGDAQREGQADEAEALA